MKTVRCSGTFFIGLVFLALGGCEFPQPDDCYDQISREIDLIRAQAEAAAAGSGNIRVQVNNLAVSSEDYFAIDSLFRYTDGNVVVAKVPDTFRRSGLRIGIGDENFSVRLDITLRKLKSSEQTEMFLVLADGASGFIFVGKEIYVRQFYYRNRWYSAVEYDFRRAGRSLQVAARTLSNGMIELELTPVFSRFLNNGSDLVLTELTTTVIARPGQTLVIGGANSDRQDISTALFRYSRQSQSMKNIITITPTIQ